METKKNISQEEWNVLAKKYFGNCTEDEVKALQKEIEAMDQSDIATIEDVAEKINLHYKLNKFDPGAAYKQVELRIKKKKSRYLGMLKQNYWMTAAAVILLAFIVGSVWFLSGSLRNLAFKSSEVYVDDYGVSKVELPDGSIVSLNRDTKINYPDRFTHDTREVSIEGEAFFEVKPDPNKPFIIHAGKASIEVLGTSFNVNAYPGYEKVEVVVTTGKVSVYDEQGKQSPKSLTLDPGDKGVFVHDSKELLKMVNDNPNYLAWKTRHLIFKDTSLRDVIAQLQKLYRIEIKTSGNGVEDLTYTGHFENQSIDFILEVIARTHKIELVKENNKYLLSRGT